MVGTPYVSGQVVVDAIRRMDAGNTYGVQVRMKNTTNQVLAVEFRFRFVNRKGGEQIPYLGISGAEERWTGVVFEPYGVKTMSDFSRIIGAEGFRLFVRPQESLTEGESEPAKE